MKHYARLAYARLALLGLSIIACGGGAGNAADTFEVALISKTDLELPLAGVSWSIGGRALGKSAQDGAFRESLPGPEGRVVTLSAACPPGYQEAPIVAQVRLKSARDLTGRVKPIRHEAVCARRRVDVVLVVHAPDAAGIPVRVDGHPSAVTDALGIAHLYLPSPRDTKRIDVTLDTSEQPNLRPASPSRSFELHSRDAVLVFEQEFSSKKVSRVVRKLKRRHVPVRVD